MAFTKSHGVLIFGGLFVALIGVIGLLTVGRIIDSLLERQLPLEPGSESYKGWKKVPFPIYQRFYYFNVTNPEEILSAGAKPVLVEVGPYTWRAEWVKEAVQWNDNGTLQYRERKRYWFDRQHSSGDENDVITTINTPLVAASQKLRGASPLIKLAVSVFLDAANETLFIRRSIKQLTYEGYPDVLARLSHIIDPRTPVENGKFAYMAGKNDTNEGVFNVFTGKGNLRMFNQIEKWNGSRELPWWQSNTTCAKLAGTNGGLVHPILPTDQHINFFNPVFCKTWRLTRAAGVTSQGLQLVRFVAGPEILYNSSKTPSHKCFEMPGKPLPSGGMDVSRCQFGLPLVLSYPHFYAADEEYLRNVVGLKPVEEKHRFHLDLEPRMGIALGLAARAQINVKLERINYLRYFRQVRDIVIPVFWQEVAIEQTPEFADHIRSLLDRPIEYITIADSVTIAVGLLVVLCTVIWVIFTSWILPKTAGTRCWTTPSSTKKSLPKEIKDLYKVALGRSFPAKVKVHPDDGVQCAENGCNPRPTAPPPLNNNSNNQVNLNSRKNNQQLEKNSSVPEGLDGFRKDPSQIERTVNVFRAEDAEPAKRMCNVIKR